MQNGKTISSEQFIPLTRGTALLGLDLGERTIGAAVCDESWLIASPLKTVVRRAFQTDMEALEKLLQGRKIGGIVSGLPLEMSGNEGERARVTRLLAERIAAHFDLPLCFHDERWSSKAVERFMIREGNYSRKKRKELIDNSAAAYILQGFVDAANGTGIPAEF